VKASHRAAITGVAVLGLVLTLGASAARAQVAYAPPDLSGEAPAEGTYGQHAIQEASIDVPLWFDVPRDIVRPGVHLGGRVGLDWGFFGAFIDAGAALVPVDLGPLGRDPLVRLHLGVGGRVQYPHPRVRPYLDVIFDFNGWSFRNIEFMCAGVLPGGFWCVGTGAFEFAPGFTGRAGVQIVVKGPWAIDLGVAAALSFAGTQFSRTEFWLSPLLGVSLRN
jgi:hypothetical protein